MKGVINLKTDRNYGGVPYPVYPNGYESAMPMGPVPISGMPGIMPLPDKMPGMMDMKNKMYGMGMKDSMPGMIGMPDKMYDMDINITNTEINTFIGKIDLLEKRVTNLEKMVLKTPTDNYNTSNYQMM